MRREVIESIPPSTYLFQPPVEEVKVICRPPKYRYRDLYEVRIRRAGGVTFGAVLAKLKRRSKRAEVYIEAEGVVLMAAWTVKAARMSHVIRQLYQHSMLQVQKGLPAVPEAEFERLRELGRCEGWEATWSFLESDWCNAG
jgi:hypothetical protein